jgi:hypothetical protein
MRQVGFHGVHTINLLNYKDELDNAEDEVLEKKLESDVLNIFELLKSSDFARLAA